MAGEMGVVGKLANTDPSFSQMLKSIQVLLFLVPASAGFYVRSPDLLALSQLELTSSPSSFCRALPCDCVYTIAAID